MGDELMEGDLEQLMRLYGQHTMVRYDPERLQNRFTITVGNIRLTDTDVPTEAFRRYLLRTDVADPEREKIERHFLWMMGEADLGYQPGHFTKSLIEAFTTADPQHRALLATVFPVHAEVWREAQDGSLLIRYLERKDE